MASVVRLYEEGHFYIRLQIGVHKYPTMNKGGLTDH